MKRRPSLDLLKVNLNLTLRQKVADNCLIALIAGPMEDCAIIIVSGIDVCLPSKKYQRLNSVLLNCKTEDIQSIASSLIETGSRVLKDLGHPNETFERCIVNCS